MKMLVTIFVLLLSSSAVAKDKLWISNKLEIGYGKIFISEQVRFDRNEFTRNRIASGLRFKISDTATFKTFYLLENALKNDWKNNHFLGTKLEFKLQ